MTDFDVIPYPGLVICPENISPHDLTFKRQFQRVFLQHDAMIQTLQPTLQLLHRYGIEARVRWVFSSELLWNIYSSYPYNDSQSCPWVADLIPEFDSFFSRCQKGEENRFSGYGLLEDIPQEDLANIPDLLTPSYCTQETRMAWRALFTHILKTAGVQSVMACSDDPKFDLEIHIQGEGDISYFCYTIEIPRNWPELIQEADTQEYIWKMFLSWSALRKKFDPWYKNNLPISGECPYIPPDHWNPEQDFIRSRQGSRGFLDRDGRSWEWDEQEQHWDVQERISGRDRYSRVWPDGRFVDRE